MSAKAILIFCAQAFLAKSVLSSCIVTVTRPVSSVLAYEALAAPVACDELAGWSGRELEYHGLAAPLGYDGLAWTSRRLAPALDYTPTNGGALPVSSGSAMAPVGISVLSENAYDCILDVVGELPFVGTVGFEGLDLPTLGAGAVNHACGNGDNSMVSDDAVFTPEYYGAYAPGLGYRAGWAGRRIGYTR